MKIGVKTYDSFNFLKHFENKVDFFEVQAISGKSYSFLKKFSLPIVIHAEHQGFGVNIADLLKEEFNLNAINFAKKIADMTNAKKIILHPGGEIDKNTNITNAINFIKKYNDRRFLIENLPDSMLFPEPEEIEIILKETGAGFCFDLNHALSYAWKNKIDFYEITKKFLALNPKHFHIGGQIFLEDKDITHLPLTRFEGDLKKFLKLFPRDAEITLEVSTDIKETEKDIRMIKKIIKKII